jgi:hypothetical protein
MTIVGAGNRITALGASTVIAASSGGTNCIESDGFFYHVLYGAGIGGQLRFHPVEANGGESLATSLSRAQTNYPTHAATYGFTPSHCVIMAGRNDMTTSDIAGKLTTYEAILDTLLGQGILPVVCAIIPADTTTQMANTAAYNAGLAGMAARKGLLFIDPTHLVIVESDGSLNDTYSLNGSDPQHMNAAGAKLVGEYIGQQIVAAGIVPAWDVPLIAANDANTGATYKLGNGLLLTDTTADGIPDNWSTNNGDSGSVSYALADASADGVAGNWFQITKTATTVDTILSTTINSPTVGNWYAIGWAHKWDYTSGSGGQIRTEIRTQAAVNLFRTQINNDEDLPVSRPWYVFQVPSGTTSLSFRILMNAVGTYAFGQPTVIDLTAAGLDGWK